MEPKQSGASTKKINTPKYLQPHIEDKEKQTQLQTIFSFLENNIATTSMVAEATGIKRRNICRYKRDLEKKGVLWETEKKPCLISGHKAWYICTNQNLIGKKSLTN